MHAGKAKRKLGVQRRAIPFLSFYSVVQEADRRGGHTKRFDLRVVSGRVFQFECRNVEECDEWVKHILVRGGPATSGTLCGCKFVLRRVTGWVAGSWVAGGWWSPPCVLFLTVTVRASTRQRCRGQDPVRGPHALREEGTPRLAQKRSHGACGWR